MLQMMKRCKLVSIVPISELGANASFSDCLLLSSIEYMLGTLNVVSTVQL